MRTAPDDFPPPGAPYADAQPRNPRLEYDYARPWERQPCDTDTYWGLFKRYLYQVPPRRLTPGRMSAHDMRVFVECKWEERAQAWDDDVTGEEERIARTARLRHLRLAEREGAIASRAYDALEREQTEAPRVLPLGMTPRDALRYADVSTRRERVLLGLDKAPVVLPGQGQAGGAALDTSRLTPEELEALRALLVKAGAT